MSEYKNYTKEDEHWLREHYLISTPQELKDRFPYRSLNTIRGKAVRIGLKTRERSKPWSKQEKDRLLEQFPVIPDGELQQLFPNRTIKDIYDKAERMKLTAPKRRNFTKEEEELLIKVYTMSKKEELEQLFPDRSIQVIKNKANQLGLRKRKSPKIWSTSEEQWMRDYYSIATDEELLERFQDCTMDQITTKAYNMQLKRKFITEIKEIRIENEKTLMKNCAKCKKFKPLIEFSKSAEGVGGYDCYCKQCDTEYERQRRANMTKEQKEKARRKNKFYARQRYRENPEKYAIINRRSHAKNKDTRNAKQRESYSKNKDLYREQNKIWRTNNREFIKAKNLNRKAMKRNLENSLTGQDIKNLLGPNGEKYCALTGQTGDINLEHFIPLAWGHGGTYKGNIYHISRELNFSKRDYNPFEWLERADIKEKVNQDLTNKLISRLAEDHHLTIHEFWHFVYWCEQNKRTLEQIQTDPRPSIEIWKTSLFVL